MTVSAFEIPNPPIIEVVCGVHFEALPIDTFDVATYWQSRRNEYPIKALAPAIVDGPSFTFGVAPPMRGLFTSADDTRVLQLQNDRMFVNWRKRRGAYPRFSSGTEGLKARALQELAVFQDFARKDFGREVTPTKVELSKVDLLTRGEYWQTFDELQRLLKDKLSAGTLVKGQNPEIALRLSEEDSSGGFLMTLGTVRGATGAVSAIQIETRVRVTTEPDKVDAAFTIANTRANELFFALVDDGILRGDFKEATAL